MHCLTRAVTDGTIPGARIEVTKRGNGSEKRYKGPEERKRYQLLHHGCDCSGPTSTVVLSCTRSTPVPEAQQGRPGTGAKYNYVSTHPFDVACMRGQMNWFVVAS